MHSSQDASDIVVNRHNFYIYNWKDIGACLEMDVCGVKAIPPFGDDSTPSTEGSGSGMTVVAVLLVAGVAAAIFKSKSQGGKMTSTSGESMYADDSDLNFKLDSPA